MFYFADADVDVYYATMSSMFRRCRCRRSMPS